MRHNQKLTAEDAEHIRQLHEWKQSEIRRLNDIADAEALARKYGVHRRAIEKVLHYKTR